MGEREAKKYSTGRSVTRRLVILRVHEARLFFGDGIVRESRAAWGANSFQNELDMTTCDELLWDV